MSERSPTDAPGLGEQLDLKGRLDRFGELLARGLDLAEAGLSLGLTVASTVGAAAQQKIFERMMDAAAEPAPSAPPPAPAQAAPEPDPAYGISNRMRLSPGARVAISFSINNDAATAPRAVALRLEPLAGERHGACVPAGALRLHPETAAIAPLDFEKFVLDGALPPDLPPDLYRGAVLVAGESQMRIPVWLLVEAEPGG